MATSVELVQIRYLKKDQITSSIVRIYQECCHSGLLHFKLTKKHNQTSSHSVNLCVSIDNFYDVS